MTILIDKKAEEINIYIFLMYLPGPSYLKQNIKRKKPKKVIKVWYDIDCQKMLNLGKMA